MNTLTARQTRKLRSVMWRHLLLGVGLTLSLSLIAPPLLGAQETATPESAACSAAEMTLDQYNSAISTQPNHADRSYTVTGPADAADADAAIMTLTQERSCRESGAYRQTLSLYSAYGLYWLNSTAYNMEAWNEHQSMRIDTGFGMSSAFDPASSVRADESAASESGSSRIVYLAENAMALEDGRIAVLQTTTLPTGTSGADGTVPEIGAVVILVNEDGTWVIDETLPLCFGNCETNRALLESLLMIRVVVPQATPESD